MGFYLIGSLVAAINPEDLDAMDESVPFTKYTLDNILGIQTSIQDYKHYWDQFKVAQGKRVVQSQVDNIKKSMNWEAYFNEFVNNQMSTNFPCVQQFKQQLKQYA